MYPLATASYKRLTIYNEKNIAEIEVEFESFWSNTASFVHNGSTYTFKPASILLKMVEVTKGNLQVGMIDFDWKMEATVRLENTEGMTKMFTIKAGSLLNRSYVVQDFLTNHLLTIEHKWNWTRFNYDYYISHGEGIADDENNMDPILFLVTALYVSYLISKKRRRRRNG